MTLAYIAIMNLKDGTSRVALFDTERDAVASVKSEFEKLRELVDSAIVVKGMRLHSVYPGDFQEEC